MKCAHLKRELEKYKLLYASEKDKVRKAKEVIKGVNMIYEYRCGHCEKHTLITKPMSQASRVERCNKCNNEMQRVFNTYSMKSSDGVKS